MMYITNLLLKIMIALRFQLQNLQVFGQVSHSEFWKLVKVDPIQFGKEITVVADIHVISKFRCSIIANYKGVNSFCYKDGLCRLFQMNPCLPSNEDLKNNNDLRTCFSTTGLIVLRSKFSIYKMPIDAKFHKYVGCYWFCDSETGNFLAANEKCKENGGQLISFEHFSSRKEFEDFASPAGLMEKKFYFVGLSRMGPTSDFKWLTGTTLNNTSFLWLENEPDDYERYKETNAFGYLCNLSLCDIQEYRGKGSICHIYVN